MIWLAWRQHRVSLLAGGAAIAALSLFLLATGNGMRTEFARLGLDACSVPTHLSCTEASRSFADKYAGYQMLIPLLLLVPALVGVFWGAPLVARELEHGTHRMVWMQSVSRRRWLLTKVALLGGATTLGLGLLTWIVNWWVTPIMDTRPQSFEPGIFDLLGIVPVAYGLAALMLGVAAGSVTRKLVPAIALTLALFLGLRIGVEFGMRPHFMEPVSGTFALPMFGTTPQEADLPTGWMLLEETVTANGLFVGDGVGIEMQSLREVCPEAAAAEGPPPIGDGPSPAPPDIESPTAECAERLGFRVSAVYHPAERYWRFQLTEAAIYLLLSGGLLAGSVWWIRRRVS
jgi:hypothetical protein